VFGTALVPGTGTAVAATAVVGLCSGPIAVIASILTQSETPDELRGFAIATVGLLGAYAGCGAVEVAGLLMLLLPGFRRAARPTR
jgi:hypothetical protein